MKDLYLIRHAKSSWADDSLPDRARPLSARGQSQLAPLGRALARHGGFEGQMYASPATRAQATLEGILPATVSPERVHVCPELYTFDFRRLARWLMDREDDGPVAVIGHNPALLELAQWLVKHPPTQLPTASFVHIRAPVRHWRQLAKGKGKLETLLTPSQFSYSHFARKLKKRAATDGTRPGRDIPVALQHQLELMHQLAPGVIIGLDDEFLHQYRIAIRRSRAIAESVQEVTGNNLLAKPVKELKRYANATSRLRDLHVFLQQLPTLSAANDELRTALHTYFEKEADNEQQRLVKKLTGKRYRKSLTDWQNRIESGKLEKLATSLSHKDIRKTAGRRIDEINRRSAVLTCSSPDEDFHRLRKLLKRTRYLMELDRAGWKKPLKVLKERQKHYGRFQDLHVQIQLLEQFRSNAPDILPAALRTLEVRLEQQKADVRNQILALGGLDGTPI
ncbi:CHAD domain-containing protein [Marinobacter sp. F4218]|uniref:CHAD domain-containing protein n=1 Tax=Marinobacter sp. F4218 TaxID=2862868 RepID=UPI001C627295|nr:CHAD domain-containing protein [Marinobacter sp. F4218]MBW7472119.1 CHAD domain-containing protein [Marinobacter sp. F4218]